MAARAPAKKKVAAKAVAKSADSLERYRAKRRFEKTPEPRADAPAPTAASLGFVIQKHWASRLHYDFRLELDGVLLSWAVPKGPSYDPKDKRMAIRVEDHPVSYGGFEGTIPPKQYGAGKVIVWDQGQWAPVGDAREGLAAGKLVFKLHGQKLAGLWELVRIAKKGDKQDAWMLFKKRDAWARPATEYDVIAALPDSVLQTPLGPVEAREPREAANDAKIGRPSTGEADLSKARRAGLPATLAPQLATAATRLPPGEWALEAKWDGYRLLARIEAGEVRLFTRNGNDWTSKMRSLAKAVATLPTGEAWLDGEIVVLDEQGAPDFNALQNAMDGGGNDEIVYMLFDAPFLNGMDLREVPLVSRRAALRAVVEAKPSDRLRFSEDFDVPPAQMMAAAKAMHLEGIIAKRVEAPYVSRRSESWLKLKHTRRQEFVVIGFHDRENAPKEVGSLLLGYYDGGALQYAGNVGTGWDHRTGADLHRRLVALEVAKPPLKNASIAPGRWSRRTPGTERWVKPELVVEIAFGEWTPEGRVRHAVYQGLREDKPAKAVRREPDAKANLAALDEGGTVVGMRISHPERVIDASTGLRKIDLVRYYETIAPWLLPHLRQRPVSLVRAPDGIEGQLFFQKHPETRMPGLRVLDAKLWPGHEPLLAIDSVEALVAAAQMNVIELHTWNSTTRHIDQPDRIVFDLDPGEGVTWPQVQEGALLMHTMLEVLGLRSWLKTSGGKGLHVVVPIAPKRGYAEVKDFSQRVVEHVAKTIPHKFVAKSGPKNRIGRIFIDYLRNGHGQTTVAAFSARARPGMGVSMPVAWEQLKALKSASQWTIATAREYVSFQGTDPWAEYGSCRQDLKKALGLLPAR